VSGTQTVRYGSAGRWISKSVTGGGQCTDAFFGNKQALGVSMQCELVGDALSGTPVIAADPTPAPTISTTSTTTTQTTSTLTPIVSLTTTTTIASGPTIDMAKIPLGSAGASTENVAPTTEQAPLSDGGAFRTVCAFSHMSTDDPIVFPGKPGAAHLHTFFGNTGTNAASTATSIATTGNSTCRGGTVNRSSYWVPTLIDTKDGRPIAPDSLGVYYKQSAMLTVASAIQPMPAGLRMISGDAAATKAGSDYRFKCIGGPNNSNDNYGPSIPNCDAGAAVWAEVFFPMCWDGKNLDSPDHKSHMSYPTQLQQAPFTWSCPATHPVELPQVTFNVIYTVPEKDAARRWRLSSDNYDSTLPGGYSSHGDWFNGWKPEISQAWAKNCTAASKDCHAHLLGDGRAIF
jgi:hypothetical protein